jgi:2-isopropylmalate synthase
MSGDSNNRVACASDPVDGSAPQGNFLRGGGRPVAIYDTTLRDGAQREGISWSLEDKLRIIRRLDALGIDIIEAGWPGSNPKDAALFARMASPEAVLKHAQLAAFGSTRRAGMAAVDDPQVQALVDAQTPVCTIFGKSSTLHVREVLRVSLDENLAMIADTIAFLRAAGRQVVYDAEHFFDGYALDPEYAIATLQAAAAADTVVLCDTNGGTLPWQVEEVVRVVQRSVATPLGIHAHNDAGCAVANSLAAVRAGASHVQGTINGYGERCGNANLCSVIPGLALKLGMSVLPEGQLIELPEVSHMVAELANLAPDDHAPYVGRSAFAHKGGVHVAAMRRTPESYQHVDPALVGNECRIVVSELSGRANLLSRADELGLGASDPAIATGALAAIKEAEARGAAFEAADASVALILRRHAPDYAAPFQLVEYRVLSHGGGPEPVAAEATVKLRVGDRIVHTAAEGEGPVHALDAALHKALVVSYPRVAKISLADYKVRILDGSSGTRAVTRVLIDFTDGTNRWSTVGASASILEATWTALADGIEFGIATAAQSAAHVMEAHA